MFKLEDTSDENCEIGQPIYNISCASKLDDTLDKNCEIGWPIYNITCVFKLDDTSDKNRCHHGCSGLSLQSENYEISENKEEECLNKESEVMWGEVTQGEVMGEAMGDATGEAK